MHCEKGKDLQIHVKQWVFVRLHPQVFRPEGPSFPEHDKTWGKMGVTAQNGTKSRHQEFASGATSGEAFVTPTEKAVSFP